jgi:hypothetical protein
MNVSGQPNVPAALHPVKNPGIHSIGDLVGPRAGLDVSKREKSLVSTGIRNLATLPRLPLFMAMMYEVCMLLKLCIGMYNTLLKTRAGMNIYIYIVFIF